VVGWLLGRRVGDCGCCLSKPGDVIAIGACEQAAEGQRLEELLAGVTVTQKVLESHRSEEEEFLEAIGDVDWVEDDAGEWYCSCFKSSWRTVSAVSFHSSPVQSSPLACYVIDTCTIHGSSLELPFTTIESTSQQNT
jgi:hypothetical protein